MRSYEPPCEVDKQVEKLRNRLRRVNMFKMSKCAKCQNVNISEYRNAHCLFCTFDARFLLAGLLISLFAGLFVNSATFEL